MKEVSLITTEAISTTKEEIATIIKSNPIQMVERDKDLKVAKATRKVFRDKRLEIQGQCNEFTKQLNDAKKKIKNIALDLIDEIKPFEDQQDEQIKAFEEERARKKREEQERELKRIKVLNETIAGFKGEVNAKINSCTIDNIQDVRDFISSFDFDAQEKSAELNLFINQSIELLAVKEPILRTQKEQAIKEAERIAKEQAIKEAQEKKEAELKAREEAVLRKEREALKKIEDKELEVRRIAEKRRQELEAQKIALEKELMEEEKRVKAEKEKAITAIEAKKKQREETITIPLSEYNRLLEVEKLYNKLCN